MQIDMLKTRLVFSLLATLLLSSCGLGLCVSSDNCFADGSVIPAELVWSNNETVFGRVAFGGSQSTVVVLSNVGSIAATDISSLNLPSPYSFVGGSFPGTGGTCSATLVSGASCTLAIAFAAPQPPAGDFDAEATLSYFDGVAQREVSLALSARSDNGAFNLNRGANGSIHTISVLPDRMIVGGNLRSFGKASTPYVAVVETETYGPDPSVTMGSTSGTVVEIFPAEDGAGDFYVASAGGIKRFNSNGAIDSAFNSGGLSTTFAAAPTRDGSGAIYVGGFFTDYLGTAASNIVRILPDGAYDPSFIMGAGFDGPVYKILPTTDGNALYVGGLFQNYQGVSANRIVKLLANGTRDASFVVGTGFDSNVYALALDSLGNLYVGGYFGSYRGSGANRVVRILPNGTADVTFAIGAGFDAIGSVYAISVATDGSGDVYLGGTFNTYQGVTANRLIKLQSNGTRIASFAVVGGFDGFGVRAIAPVFGSSDIYVGGYFNSYQGTGASYLTRLKVDGSINTSMPTGSGFNEDVNTLLEVSGTSGELYVGGYFTSYNGTPANYLIRLDRNGAAATSFNIGTGFDERVLAIAPAPDTSGDIYVAGWFQNYQGVAANRIIRLNSDGTRDTAFAIGTGLNSNATAVAGAADASQRVYIGGDFTAYKGVAANYFVCVDNFATRVAGFVMGAGFNGPVKTITPLASGQVYVGGQFTAYDGTASASIVRLNANGSVDSTFAIGTGFNSNVMAIVPLEDGSGKIYVGGLFGTYQGVTQRGIVRLNSDGSQDTAFSVGSGLNMFPFVNGVCLAKDGSGDIFIGGAFSSYQGTGAYNLLRLNSDGSRDTSLTIKNTNTTSDPIGALKVSDDGSGDLYLGGMFIGFNGVSTGGLARINADGTVE